MKKLYTTDEIQQLILKYKKSPSSDLYSKINDAFEGFIIKYAHFIKYNIHSNDKDLNEFASILESYNILKCIYNVFRTWDIEDIIGEFRIIFFECIKKYKDLNGPKFTGYIYNYYKYDIFKWLKKQLDDVMNSAYINEVKDTNIDNEIIDLYEHICISDKTPLTSIEKYILYLSYGKQLDDTSISKLLNISRQLVNNIKIKAKKTLIGSGITLEDFKKF